MLQEGIIAFDVKLIVIHELNRLIANLSSALRRYALLQQQFLNIDYRYQIIKTIQTNNLCIIGVKSCNLIFKLGYKAIRDFCTLATIKAYNSINQLGGGLNQSVLMLILQSIKYGLSLGNIGSSSFLLLLHLALLEVIAQSCSVISIYVLISSTGFSIFGLLFLLAFFLLLRIITFRKVHQFRERLNFSHTGLSISELLNKLLTTFHKLSFFFSRGVLGCKLSKCSGILTLNSNGNILSKSLYCRLHRILNSSLLIGRRACACSSHLLRITGAHTGNLTSQILKSGLQLTAFALVQGRTTMSHRTTECCRQALHVYLNGRSSSFS